MKPVALLLAAALLAGCGGSDLTFRRAEVFLPAPAIEARAAARLPVQLSWDLAEESDIRRRLEEGSAYFVVFIDRPPVAVGESIGALVEECREDEDCNDPALFAEAGIRVTRTPGLVLTTLPDRRTSTAADAPDRHVATVVLADGDGVRTDELSFTIPFTIDRSRP